jgi:hypothetical protein
MVEFPGAHFGHTSNIGFVFDIKNQLQLKNKLEPGVYVLNDLGEIKYIWYMNCRTFFKRIDFLT